MIGLAMHCGLFMPSVRGHTTVVVIGTTVVWLVVSPDTPDDVLPPVVEDEPVSVDPVAPEVSVT